MKYTELKKEIRDKIREEYMEKKNYDFCQHCEDFNDDCYDGKREDCPFQKEIEEQNRKTEKEIKC